VRNEEVLLRVKQKRNILQTIRSKANWIGHIWCRNCLLKHIIEGKIDGGIEVTGRKQTDISRYWMTLRMREDTGI
jgi:hypothetical protein